MNLSLKPLALVASLLLTTSAFAGDAAHDGNGRYQAFFNPPGGLWILDTQTGDVKLCINQGPDTAPSCTAWTKNPS
jgi:hypothetical protein